MKRLFILSIAFVVVLGAALGALLYVSLIPFFHEIGMAATALLMVAIGCAAILLVTFTYSQVGCMLSRRHHAKLSSRIVAMGDVVAALDYTGNWVHLSAMHEAAKVPPPQPLQIAAPAPPKPEPFADKETVIELFNLGNSLRDIASRTGVSYYNVQKWTSEEKKQKT